MRRVQIMAADEAAAIIDNHDTIIICGCENLLLPEKVLKSLGERYKRTGAPVGLTEIHPIVTGMGPDTGLEHFAHPGMVKKAIGSGFSFLKTSKYSAMLRDNAFEAHVLPMGTIYQMLEDIAVGKRETVTEIGIGTFVDPRFEGGRMNSVTVETLARYEEHEGRARLVYNLFPIHKAIIRGTTADVYGNISLEREPVSLGVKAMAMAVKASGGKVIAQVSRLTEGGTIHPRMVEVPGTLVDVVVVDEDQYLSGGEKLNPYLTGELRMPEPITGLTAPPEVEAIILKRAAQEIIGSPVVNLGVGIPVDVPKALRQLKGETGTTFMLEHGAIDGFPSDRAYFGTHINPLAIIDSTDVFRIFRGGGLDMSFLGFGQIDAEGNVNVSKFNNIVPGCGGFIDITSCTSKLVFCGTFTAGGADIRVENGKLRIVKEGKYNKFVPRVEQVTLNGKAAYARGTKVLYVTERAVFSLQERGLRLEEIVEGVDLEQDVLKKIPFDVEVSPDLKRISIGEDGGLGHG